VEPVRRGIPVVVIDSGLQSDAHSSFVATDNEEGGRMGARRLGEVMRGEGKAILLRYSEGSASTRNREEGFLEAMAAEYPDIELISTNQYAGATKESAFQVSQNLLNKYPDVDGIFCPNESSAFGMLRALQTSGKAGSVRFVGFDTSESLIDGVRAGSIDGLVAQDPFDMGYQGVKTAAAVLEGKPVPKRIATRLAIITPVNLDDPSIQELIHPDLDRWLD
jgi:ribose transport system substrate-binding protein